MREDATTRRGETVLGIVATRQAVNAIIRELSAAGIGREHISLVVSVVAHRGEEIGSAGEVPYSPEITAANLEQPGEAAEILSRSLELTLPGAGPVHAAGPLTADLVRGLPGLAKILPGLGIPQSHAGEYEARIREGNVLIAVQCDGECKRARATLIAHGAIDVREREEEGPPSGTPPGHYHYQE